MDGLLAKFFFACLWTETESRSINCPKKTRPISNDRDRKKERIYYLSFGENLLAGHTGKSRAGKIAPILPAQVANHSAQFSPSKVVPSAQVCKL